MVSEDFVAALLRDTIKAGTPFILATLGEIYAERSGILNLGVEGMMSMGALSAFMVAYITGDPFLGIIVATVVGGLMSLIHAFVSITVRANQVVSGLALTILGLGLSGFLGKGLIGYTAPRLTPTRIPYLVDIPIVGPALFGQDLLVYLSIILALVLWFVLFKTVQGLKIRTVGENPAMADSLGVNVYLVRYLCTFIGGLLAGLSGAYLSTAYTPLWAEGMTAGRGWIAIALTIFAAWNPMKALLGAYLFGGITALQFRLQAMNIGISAEFLLMTPYAATILVLIVLSSSALRRRVGVPAALGVPYYREE
jgi:simple sugar transport system permease protein